MMQQFCENITVGAVVVHLHCVKMRSLVPLKELGLEMHPMGMPSLFSLWVFTVDKINIVKYQ